MSERAWNWAWVCRGLTPTLRLVLLALAEHADDDGETCLPALGVLERMTGLSRRRLAKTLNALETAGVIAREPSECHGSTTYRLLLDRSGSVPDSPGNNRNGKAESGP